jgi:hypothetical protein
MRNNYVGNNKYTNNLYLRPQIFNFVSIMG